ncbi:MAG: 16S rRNA (guanine(966)-N(2))-methyltransferase RsmD [Nitrosomonas sp.]|nr:16S rRNA (guanine(966)-N(2))-methyltransferase RsmD [Nitrosomonas sp.]MDP1951608.1 16S rRNA (guanine(966)-N(2))-methyltransferase RsmD [Nitrosomonas sp.]
MATRGNIRIIGGEWRSRIITFPNQGDLRPTPDRVRETVFNWLGQDLSGKICLDLFAGSGVLGFEAASRGAKQVVMIESDPRVYKALQESKVKLKATQIELVMMKAMAFMVSDLRQFDVVFLDPPYRLELLPKLLSILPSHLAKDSLVYIEGENFLIPDKHWLVWRSKRAGKVCYQLIKLTDANG